MSVFEQQQWAFSFKNKAIPLFASSEKALDGTSSPILFIGGVHGDEPEGVELAKKTLQWLKSDAYQKHTTTPEKPAWVLIECINPDGFAAGERVNAQGIDLNRNFPSQNWIREAKAPRYFPGNHPLESVEVLALCKLIEKIRPQVIIHAHSWNPCVVCTGPENHPYARALAEASGYALVNDIGYPTPGSLGEYGWHQLQIPVICIEEQEKVDLSLVWGHFQPGIEQIFLPAPRP